METMKPIYLYLVELSGKLGIGESQFLGNPDLPSGFDYPSYIDDEGDEFPYFFVCQINLADLAAFDPENPLPHVGMLSFFAKIDHYMGYEAATECIGGRISDPEAVKVFYFPDCRSMEKRVLVDDEGFDVSPHGLKIMFSHHQNGALDDHMLFAPPSHRQWESWDHPYEDRIILLQIDSVEGEDFDLNFMDCGVLDFLISPSDLRNHRFEDVRGIVLSS